MPSNYKKPRANLTPEVDFFDYEAERAKNIRNNHFVQIQAFKFNSVSTVHDLLISNFWEIAPNIEYCVNNVTKYTDRQNREHSILVYSHDNNFIYQIEGLREGEPKTAFDCLVALNYGGDDYAAALAI